jgi:uncharacterized protein (TIGR00156 family)
MNKKLVATAAFFTALTFGGIAQAQYVGPTTATATTVKQVIDSGKDDQYATLQGNIVSRTNDEWFTFKDATGTIAVEISSRHFPAGQPVDDKTRVEISGEIEKKMARQAKIDVKQLKVLP